MLIIKSIPRDPVATKCTCLGSEIDLSLRPIDQEIMEELREKAKVYRFAQNPATGLQELGAATDDDLYTALLYDWVIADFKGVGSAKDQPWPVDLKHKNRLAAIAPAPGEEPVAKYVIRFARELGAKRHAELEAERKNS